MGQVLHGCATTTEAIRRAIQNSQESPRARARCAGTTTFVTGAQFGSVIEPIAHGIELLPHSNELQRRQEF